SKVQALSIMILVGGILACLIGVAWSATCVGLFLPGTYYSFGLGIMAIIKASDLLGARAYRSAPPKPIALTQITHIVCFDVINLTLGIIELVFLNEREVQDYFRG